MTTTEEELKYLSVAQAYDLNQQHLESTIEDRPLISATSSLSDIRKEYENGNSKFLKQIDDLTTRNYTRVNRAKGDGDCFYRSLAFAFIDRVLRTSQEDRDLAVATTLSKLAWTKDLLRNAQFEAMIYEDGYDMLESIIRSIVAPNPEYAADGGTLTQADLLRIFQDAEHSNMIVFYFRLLTSAELQTNAVAYEAFLEDPELGGEISPRDYCNRFVETLGKEAEHVSMTALSRALHVDISIAYLDGREESISFLQLPDPPLDPTQKPITLLYRPGHYDVLLHPED